MRLYILGAGTPTPAHNRYGSSYIVKVADEYLMFDCGPATTYKLAKAGMSPTDVDYLFFTHHHSDHDVDYPCFLLSRWDLSIGVENNLQVFGPKLTERLTHRILDEKEGAFAHDWIARINHPLSLNAYKLRGGILPRIPPSVQVKDVGPGKVCQGKDWTVTAALAEHVQPWLDSLAYRLDSNQGSIVVTGDTRPCKSVLDLAKGSDVLVCLCVDEQSEIAGTPEEDYMCGSTAAATMAQEAGVKKLVLVHQKHTIDEPGSTERVIADITKVYDGSIIWGNELMEFDI